jgi:DNA-binding LacI/PurR family transcriptional regulator
LDIRKVAKLAGVSHMTVSNVINNKGRMSQKTREKVLRVMKEEDYYPSEAARVLSTGKKDVIAFVSARLASPFISEVLASIEDRAFEANKYVYGIEHFSTRRIESTGEELLNRLLFSKKVSAVIILSIQPSAEVVMKYRKKGVPLILLESSVIGAHSVRTDNVRASFEAVDYLAKKGRKRIGIIAGRQIIAANEELMPTSLERLKGYMDALRANGITFEPGFVEESSDYSFEDGVRALDNFIARKADLDAVFCPAGDLTAMGVMSRAKELGIKIPGDLAIIGYDDTLAAKLLSPALTTVRQPIAQMGRLAFDLALEAIQGDIEDKVINLQAEMVVRESA